MTMNRTTVGQVAVYANLVLALIFTGWAVGVWANHVDWQTPAGKGTDRKGRLETLKDEIRDLGQAQNRTLAQWAGLNKTLVSAEGQRQPRADWYTEQLELMRTGQRGNMREPYPVAQLPPTGGVDPELFNILQGMKDGTFQRRSALQRRPVTYRAEGLPASAPPVYLQSQDAYRVALQTQADSLTAVQKQIQATILEQQQASDQLNGVPGKSKGLRELLDEQRDAYNASQEEMYFLQQPTAVEQDDLRRLKRRLDQEKARAAELAGRK